MVPEGLAAKVLQGGNGRAAGGQLYGAVPGSGTSHGEELHRWVDAFESNTV